MKVAKHKTQPRRADINLRALGIASYGENNEYPIKVRDIINSSSTGQGCLSTAVRFMLGDGYNSPDLGDYIVNRKQQKANGLLKKVVEDWAMHKGFAVHVNYNAIFQAIEFQHVPFEHCRIAVNKDGMPTGQIAVHPDWTRRNQLYRKPVNKDTIRIFPTFNPDPAILMYQIEDVGGIEQFQGQIMYFSGDGELEYPLCPYDTVMTDMATEEGISTVLYRNARHNFLPSGLLVRKKRPVSTSLENEEKDSEDDGELASELTKWQGDERAAKLILVEIEYDEEEPKFVPFPIQNFDRMFDKTSTYIEAKIGKMFMQPPILRAVDVGAGWGADLMKNAYDFYNSIVESDRKTVESQLQALFEASDQLFSDYTIKPLVYQAQATDDEKLDNKV